MNYGDKRAHAQSDDQSLEKLSAPDGAAPVQARGLSASASGFLEELKSLYVGDKDIGAASAVRAGKLWMSVFGREASIVVRDAVAQRGGGAGMLFKELLQPETSSASDRSLVVDALLKLKGSGETFDVEEFSSELAAIAANRDENLQTRKFAVDVLNGAAAARRTFEEIALDQEADTSLRFTAVFALASLDDPTVVPFMRELARDDRSSRVRESALDVLKAFGEGGL